jgi:hypothetical protein
MYPPVTFQYEDTSWSLTFTDDDLHFCKQIGAKTVYEATIPRKAIREVQACKHLIRGPGGDYYTMLRLIVVVKHDAVGDPREGVEMPEPEGINYHTDYGCKAHELHMDRRKFKIDNKIPTGYHWQICIFQEYIMAEEDGDGGDWWRSSGCDALMLAKCKEMVKAIRAWSHDTRSDEWTE